MKLKLETIKVKDILPNPFRNIDAYPIDRERVEELKRSMQNTDAWPGIIGRWKGEKVEQAFGHHRVVAMRELRISEVLVMVGDLDDETMLKLMANENMDRGGMPFTVCMETVRAVVEAYAAGKITLRKLGAIGRCRVAPSFVESEGQDRRDQPDLRRFTIDTITEFLGWSKAKDAKAAIAIRALELIECGVITEQAFDGLATWAAKEVIAQAGNTLREREVQARLAEQAAGRLKVEKERAAKEEARAAEQFKKALEAGNREQAKKFEQEQEAARERRTEAAQQERRVAPRAAEFREQGKKEATAVARAVASEMKKPVSEGRRSPTEVRVATIVKSEKKDETPPWIDDVARKLATELYRTCKLHEQHPLSKRLDQLIEAKEFLRRSDAKELQAVLTDIARKALKYRKQFNGSCGSRPGEGGVYKASAKEMKTLQALTAA